MTTRFMEPPKPEGTDVLSGFFCVGVDSGILYRIGCPDPIERVVCISEEMKYGHLFWGEWEY